MARRTLSKSAVARTSLGPLVLSLAVSILDVSRALAQDATDWQVKAGGKMSFDVASVKPSKIPAVVSVGANQAPPRPPTFGLGPDDAKPLGGRFYAGFPWPHSSDSRTSLRPFRQRMRSRTRPNGCGRIFSKSRPRRRVIRRRTRCV